MAARISGLMQAKQGTDLHTGTFIQRLASDICQRGILKVHVCCIRRVYRDRRDVMLRTMEECFSEGTTWTHPQGGLFLWVRLPETIDAERLLQAALQEHVDFVPGQAFYPNGGGRNTLRLNFSCMPPAQIEDGIRRLDRAITRELAVEARTGTSAQTA